MTHALNLTLPLKQDDDTKGKLENLKEIFTEKIQPKIDEALRKSKLVHFARVVVIDDKYIQVITEYEGDHLAYAEFFRKELTPVFAAIFELAEGGTDVTNPASFIEAARKAHQRSLGTHTAGGLDISGQPEGWLFSAYDHKDVRTIQAALEEG